MASTPTLAAQETIDRRQTEAGGGSFEVIARNRTFLIPRSVVSGVTIQPTVRLQYQVTRSLRVALDAQTVDNAGPGRQGRFAVSRTVPNAGSGNFLQEVALEAALRLRHHAPTGRSLTLVAAASLATRSYAAVDSVSGDTFGGNRRRLVPTIAIEAAQRTSRTEVRGATVAVLLPADDAMYLRRIPGETAAFGALLGAELHLERRLNAALLGWGRGFVALTGHNTISRASGAPARAVVYDAGLRLDITPALAVETFVSNALGNTGALAYIADREYVAIGTGVRVRPVDRAVRQPSGSARTRQSDEVPLALAAVAPALLPARGLAARVRWGSQGLLAAVEAAPVAQLQLGAFTDLLRGTRDEGEVGAVARLSLLDRGTSVAGLVVAASRTNNPLVNLLAGRADQLHRLGLPKGGFRFGDESIEEGRLYVFTGGIAMQWLVGAHTTVRATPLVGLVQRHGVQVSGLAVGADHSLHRSVRIAAETGVALGRGNQLNDVGRSHAAPWQLAIAWQPARAATRAGSPTIDLFVTNRAGDSPFHMLRVRSRGAVSAGIGLRAAWP